MKNLSYFQTLLEKKRSLYFLGIGGVSMSSLAMAAKKMGCNVAGYDAADNAVTQGLESLGIPVDHAFRAEAYEGIDGIVFTGAIHEDDPVFAYPAEKGIPLLRRGAFLGLLMKRCANPVGVSGTHGKSTTTGMLTSIFLAEEARDPTVMAGAVLPVLNSTWRDGSGEDFLFEACEYQNSFLDFFPRIAVVLNVEHDHADFFPTLEDVIRSFTAFCDLAKNGHAVILTESEGAREVARRTAAPVFRVSTEEKADLWCENLREEKGFFSFDIVTEKGLYASVTLSVPGRHNVGNALCAAAAAYLSGISGRAVREGLYAFGGVKRRFEYRGRCGKMRVFDDYAHHPDEIRATLTAARSMGEEKITVVFQSHTYTRTAAYWNDFIAALSLADRVIHMDIYPAREEPLEGITARRMAEESPNGEYLGDRDAIVAALKKDEGDGLLIFMGAGSVVELTDKVLS